MFSPTELMIIKIIGRRKLTITQIAERLYDRDVVDANIKAGNAVRRIKRKCDYYRTPWTLEGSGTGRAGKTVWRVTR